MFARLRIPTEGAKGGVKDHGVHAFICPLRNEDGSLVNGVEIRDCGYKVGLNGAPTSRQGSLCAFCNAASLVCGAGVDNGAIAFHGVRIQRENLLDKFASVSFAHSLYVNVHSFLRTS